MAVDHSNAGGDYAYRRHEVCLHRLDWSRFADALYDTFPEGRYFYNPPIFYRMWREPPSCMTGEHMLRLGDAEGPVDPGHHSQTEMHFDSGWVPHWFVTGDPVNSFLPEPGAYWDLLVPRLPAFRFEFSFIKPAKDGHPEHMTNHGDYWFFYEPGNREHLAIGHRVFRLFRDVASNRDQLELQGLDRQVTRRRRISPLWLGHEAIRWAREDPTRMLAYCDDESDPVGVRPSH